MPEDLAVRRRNIVVIGGSAGAFPVMKEILRNLPGDLNAAVFYVQHINAGNRSRLDSLLDSASAFPVRAAEDSEPIHVGEMRTCCPDQHLLLMPGVARLARGPKENHCRPAIDPLLRSAAAHYQSRVVAVLLSGYLSDGVSGLNAVRSCGGLTMVQDPTDAQVPDMPMNALDHHEPDYVGGAARLADLIVEVVDQPAPEPGPVPRYIQMEVDMSHGRDLSIGKEQQLGQLSPFACPECGGNLWQVDDVILRYRCHVSHGFTAASLAEVQDEKLDAALWSALRGLRERAQLLRILDGEAIERGTVGGGHFGASAAELEEQADVLTRFIMQRRKPHVEKEEAIGR